MRALKSILLFSLSALTAWGQVTPIKNAKLTGTTELGTPASGNGVNLTGILASQIGFTASGTGATASTLDARARASWINAKTDFGAVGDDATDDTAALTAALARAHVTGQTLFVPVGIYRITDSLKITKSGITIIGENSQGNLLAAGGDGKGTIFRQITNAKSAIEITAHGDPGLDHVSLRDLQVVGNGATSTAPGIIVRGGPTGPSGATNDTCRFERLECQYFNVGADFGDLSNSTFMSCGFDSNNTYGMHLWPVNGVVNSNTFISCSWTSNMTAGAWMQGASSIILTGDFGGGASQPTDLICEANQLSVIGCNLEHHGTSPAILCRQGNTTFVNLFVSNFDGLLSYAIQQEAGSRIHLDNPSGIQSTAPTTLASIKQLSTIDCPLSVSGSSAPLVDAYSPGGAFYNTYRASAIASYSSSQNAGTPASQLTWGRIERRVDPSSAEQWNAVVKNADNSYSFMDYLAPARGYNSTGTFAYRNVANTFTLANTFSGAVSTTSTLSLGGNTTVAIGYKITLGGGAGADGGSLGWNRTGAGNSRNSFLMPDYWTNGDWGYYVATNTAATVPTVPRIYHDIANNRTSFGHNAASQPTGTKTLNVEGTLDVTGSATLGSAGTSTTRVRHGTSAALTAGVVVVADANTTANTRFFFSTHTRGTITLPATYDAATRSAGTSFTITSSIVTDTSTVDWLAIEP